MHVDEVLTSLNRQIRDLERLKYAKELLIEIPKQLKEIKGKEATLAILNRQIESANSEYLELKIKLAAQTETDKLEYEVARKRFLQEETKLSQKVDSARIEANKAIKLYTKNTATRTKVFSDEREKLEKELEIIRVQTVYENERLIQARKSVQELKATL